MTDLRRCLAAATATRKEREHFHHLIKSFNFSPAGTCTVFLTGGYPLLLHQNPSPVEVYNDLDSSVVYFFELLRKESLGVSSSDLHDLIGEEDYYERLLMRGYRDTILQDKERILLWYLCARQVLKRHLKKKEEKKLFKRGGTYGLFQKNPHTAFLHQRLHDIDEVLPEVHGRLFRIQFEHYPLEKVVRIYDSLETLFVVDKDHLPCVSDLTWEEVKKLLSQRDVEGRTLAFSLEEETHQWL